MPPSDVLAARLKQEAYDAIERRIKDEILKAANVPELVRKAMAQVKPKLSSAAQKLDRRLPGLLQGTPTSHWSDIVKREVAIIAGAGRGKRSKNATSAA